MKPETLPTATTPKQDAIDRPEEKERCTKRAMDDGVARKDENELLSIGQAVKLFKDENELLSIGQAVKLFQRQLCKGTKMSKRRQRI